MRSLCGVIGMLVGIPLSFSKIWCVACSFNDVQNGYSLFIKSTLTSGVFARAGALREPCSKISAPGKYICSYL